MGSGNARFLIFTATASIAMFGVVWTSAPGGSARGVSTPTGPAGPTIDAAASPAPPVYFAGCNDARAAGAAPIYRGQPGYRPEMDGDNDGIACEPIH